MFEIPDFTLIHRQRLSPMDYDKLLESLLGRSDYLVVGKSVTRSDALDKCLGSARFAADYIPRYTRVLKVLRSTEAHAIIERIDVSEALNLPGVDAVITGADIPGENQIGYALPDQPLLNDKKVHYIGDPIALIVAKDEDTAQEALKSVKVEYRPLKPVLNIDSALATGAPVIHKENNVAVTTIIRKGDAPKGFKKSKAVVEETYWSPYQEHMYLEPDVAYAIPEGKNKVTIVASSQSPHLARCHLSASFGSARSFLTFPANMVSYLACRRARICGSAVTITRLLTRTAPRPRLTVCPSTVQATSLTPS